MRIPPEVGLWVWSKQTRLSGVGGGMGEGVFF